MVRYPEEWVADKRKEVVNHGFKELRTPEEVDEFIRGNRGPALVFINSICDCTAVVRQGLIASLVHPRAPKERWTSFAGADIEAVDRLRWYLMPNPPSSPSLAIFKDGKPVCFVPREELVDRPAEEVAELIMRLYEEYC